VFFFGHLRHFFSSGLFVFFKVFGFGVSAQNIFLKTKPRAAMYGLFTYIWAVLGVNVGTSSIYNQTNTCKESLKKNML